MFFGKPLALLLSATSLVAAQDIEFQRIGLDFKVMMLGAPNTAAAPLTSEGEPIELALSYPDTLIVNLDAVEHFMEHEYQKTSMNVDENEIIAYFWAKLAKSNGLDEEWISRNNYESEIPRYEEQSSFKDVSRYIYDIIRWFK
ncbi:uncharacterized protein KQ657_001298 [Scheffersomyces spartinae]|uniref:Uncharacterized protein n=1 Tax=Scheffersomyces spartinae TaxID=45513 RepID=A0A9P7V7U9_9ASCO|nr:uncharacterized protein KQ657_001298 [Scheffersomyces spartinae]KAG7192841.1 hypothetical protein KQ657_001298 [Scheffersomyces spartinae]